ncbi:MAG TPA: hypothetical protein VFN67_40185 [Polyangiales bacterium]|jgi:hypothetical protein|nr:hypothetical protein [Polyangiales bacterium]
MPAGQLLFQPQVAVQAALARGAGLPEHVSPECPVALYAATLSGEAVCLGRYQHEAQVLGAASESSEWCRRATGGAAVRAGVGVMYVALALHDRSSLLRCPPGRVLNRNVRGVLTGLRHAGLQINYFGRDFLSHGSEPVIYVAWDLRETGQLLLELFVAHSEAWFVPATQLAYPARNEPALRGRAPTTIDRVQPNLAPEAVFRAIADGHARAFDVIWTEADSVAIAQTESVAATREQLGLEPLSWSSPREEAIGFVSAGVGLDANGKFVRVHVAGDFFAHRACTATLETRLRGASPDAVVVGEAVDAVFARSGYDVEGIRSLSVIRDVILEAAQRAT